MKTTYIDKATMEEATGGVNNTKYVTPLTAKSVMESNGGFITDLEGVKYKAVNINTTKVYGLNSEKSNINGQSLITDSYIVKSNLSGSNIALHSKEFPYSLIKNVPTGATFESCGLTFATDECAILSYGGTVIFISFNNPGKYLTNTSYSSAIKAGSKVLSYYFDNGYISYSLFNQTTGTKEIDNKSVQVPTNPGRVIGANETYLYYIYGAEKKMYRITLSNGGINTTPINLISTRLGSSNVLYTSSQESIFYFGGSSYSGDGSSVYSVCKLNVQTGSVSILIDSDSSFNPFYGQYKNFAGVFNNGNILMVQLGTTYVLSPTMQIISSTPNTFSSDVGGSNMTKFKLLNNRYGVVSSYGYLYDVKLNIVVNIMAIYEFYGVKTRYIFTENDNSVVGLVADKYSTADQYGLLDMKRAQYKIDYVCPID